MAASSIVSHGIACRSSRCWRLPAPALCGLLSCMRVCSFLAHAGATGFGGAIVVRLHVCTRPLLTGSSQFHFVYAVVLLFAGDSIESACLHTSEPHAHDR